MRGLSTTLLVLCTLVYCTHAQYGRSYRDTWPTPDVSSLEEPSSVSSEEKQPSSTSVELDTKGDLGEPESFEADEREFTYYPVAEKLTEVGNVFYEVIDEARTSRGGHGKGKKGKKGCKKGKKGKKGKKKGGWGRDGKGKGKGKKGKKGCGIHGGWWYVWDKKHGYISGRWGDPPPHGLEREHYDHGFGHHGHKFGHGYDGHGKMGHK